MVHAGGNDSVRDTAAVCTCKLDHTCGIVRHEGRGPVRAQGDVLLYSHYSHSLGSGAMGRRGTRIQPAEICPWDEQGSHTPHGIPALCTRTPQLHWPELRVDGGQNRACYPASTLLLCAFAFLQALASAGHNHKAQIWCTYHCEKALRCVRIKCHDHHYVKKKLVFSIIIIIIIFIIILFLLTLVSANNQYTNRHFSLQSGCCM